MSSLAIEKPFLKNIIWTNDLNLVKKTLMVLFGVFILALASHLIIPFRPVPLTFQSATVILIGMAYGSRYGSYVIATYLIAGIVGLPVFTDFSPGTPVFGPTSGYLMGFLPAAWLCGYLAQKGWANSIAKSFAAACLGSIIIFACGCGVLSLQIGWEKAISFGLLPFIISEPVKLLAASALIPRFWKKS